MNKIYKYPLQVEGEIKLTLPEGAVILAVQVQRDIPCLWAIVDTNPDEPEEERTFRIIGTGHEIMRHDLEKLNYIGTFQLQGDGFIGHLFEKIA